MIIGWLVGWFNQYRKTEPGRRAMANVKLNVPMFNGLFRMLYMARFTRISQILLSTGVAVLDTMQIAGDATNNVIVIDEVKEAMGEGSKW